jgi:hypothetical protein
MLRDVGITFSITDVEFALFMILWIGITLLATIERGPKGLVLLVLLPGIYFLGVPIAQFLGLPRADGQLVGFIEFGIVMFFAAMPRPNCEFCRVPIDYEAKMCPKCLRPIRHARFW